MAYDNQFKLLTPEVVHLLSADFNSEIRRIYVDCLAVLQGLLGRFSSGPVGAAFEPDVAAKILDEYLSRMPALLAVAPSADTTQASFNQLQAKADLLRDFIIDTIRTNKETALSLYDECVSPKKAISHQVAFNLVDNFLNILVTQYRVLRYPNTQPQILQASR